MKLFEETSREVEAKNIENETDKNNLINDLFKVKRGQYIIQHVIKTYRADKMDQLQYVISSH